MQINEIRRVIRKARHEHLRVRVDDEARVQLRILLSKTANRIHAELIPDDPERSTSRALAGLSEYFEALNASALSDFQGVVGRECMADVRKAICPVWPVC